MVARSGQKMMTERSSRLAALQPVTDLAPQRSAPVRSELWPAGARYRSGMDALHRAARIVAAAGLIGELLFVVGDVLSRSLFAYSLQWSNELSEIALSAIAFIGGAAAYRESHHMAISIVRDIFPPCGRKIIAIVGEWLVFCVCAISCYASFEVLQQHWDNLMPTLQISSSWIALPFTIGMALVALYAIERLILDYPVRPVLMSGAVVGALFVGAGAVGVVPFLAHSATASLSIMMMIFLVTVLLSLPVSFAMVLATLLYLNVTDSAPIVAVPSNMIDGISNFILIALPFFIFAGIIMEKGGISVRLVRLAMLLVGRLRGGLLQVMVVTIYLVSGISGSKSADVAAVGSVMRNELRKQGYRSEEGAAVLAASAAMAETIPPSIGMLVLGSVTPISIGTLFVAGLLPAAVIAICLMALIYVKSLRHTDTPAPPGTVQRTTAIAGAVLPLAMPVMMVVGIRFGIATPTEVSSFAVVYGIVLSCLVYRDIRLRNVWRLAEQCAVIAGMVLFVMSAAASFAWVLAAADLARALITLLHMVGDRPWIFMLGSIFLLIVVGSLLEGLPAIIILAPLLLPIAVQFGFEPVQYGIVLLLAMGVGAFMPPIGIGFYVACAVAESSMEGAARTMLPYLAVLVLGVVLIAFCPWITLILPHALSGR
jgi:tripartite ATP-independent transporter DctM subunit